MFVRSHGIGADEQVIIVNVRLGVGPPDLGPGLLLLLMELSSRTAIKEGLDMIDEFLVLALRHTADLLLAAGLTQP